MSIPKPSQEFVLFYTNYVYTSFILRDCYFCASSAMHKTEFVQAINSGFGSGGMFCTLSDGDLGNYLLKKVMKFMKQEDPRKLQAVGNVGQQDINPPIFILSPEVRRSWEGRGGGGGGGGGGVNALNFANCGAVPIYCIMSFISSI